MHINKFKIDFYSPYLNISLLSMEINFFSIRSIVYIFVICRVHININEYRLGGWFEYFYFACINMEHNKG